MTTAAPTTLDAAAAEARTTHSCAHCGLDVPRGLVDTYATEQFCCSGCRVVYGLIQGKGLGRYYDMRRALERDRAPAAERSHDAAYDAFDDEGVLARFTTTDQNGLRCATLALDGLHCGACVWLIERLDRVVPGVADARADFGRSTVHVRWDDARTKFADVARGLHSMGYPASLPRFADDGAHRRDARRQLVRIGVAGALAGNIMLVTIALYAGVFEGIEPRWFSLFRWVAAGLGLLTLAWPGRVFFRGAIGAIRTRTPHLDLPIALALFAGGAWGLVNTVRGTGEIYFDSIAALVFLLLVGRFIQSQQQRRAAGAVDLMLAFMPASVRVVDASGKVTTKPVDTLESGQIVEVLAGESVPVDGCVVRGESEVDLSVLTGESMPLRAVEGDQVWAGAVNLSAPMRVRVEQAGEDTRISRLMRLVADASATKAPIVQRANRVAGVFIVVVVALAALTCALWWSHGPSAAIEHAIALLIITCPCALGLATPLVLSTALGRLSKQAVLVKGGEQLERLAKPGLILLDKTGTLTTNALQVVSTTLDDETLERVRLLESGSTHPIARAIAAATPTPDEHAEVTHHPGLGLAGTIDGYAMLVGSEDLLRGHSVDLSADALAWAHVTTDAGHTPIFVASDGRCVGGLALAAVLRDDAAALVTELQSLGWRVGILSGDDQRVVTATAHTLGITPDDAHGRVTPEGKLAVVREALDRAHGPVVMVGDGVNDAAALAAADVGIAVEGGSDASIDAADVLLRGGGLASVTRLLAGARGAIRRIHLCILVSLCYNTFAAAIAMAGLVHPLLAAVLMPVSSLTVVTIAAARGRS